MAGEFPSPCGDVVLKLAGICLGGNHHEEVSVPLRGCGFEISRLSSWWVLVSVVSVPLRGCGFEMMVFYDW